MTITEWWRHHKLIPPFYIEVKECEHPIQITAVRVYEHSIWFYDHKSSEYFDGQRLNIIRGYLKERANYEITF